MSNLRHLIRGISQFDVKSRHSEPDPGKYDKYIARLKAPTSISESIATAVKLISWISLFQLGNAAEPWTSGKYLIRNDMPVNARLAGLELLRACVQSRAGLPAVVRLMFFNDIISEFTREDFDLQITALNFLTKDARDVSGFSHRICSCLATWIDRCLASLEMRKQPIRRGQQLTITDRHDDLQRIIAYTTNLIKFNFPVLEERDISLLADRIVSVCKRTGGQGDIQHSLDFFDAVTRYGYLPADSLSEVINVVCSVLCGLSFLQDSALSVMRNFLRSHMSQATLQTLKGIIRGQDDVHDDVVLGALGFLTTRWTLNTDELSTYSFSLQSLFQSYKAGLQMPKKRADRNQKNLDIGYLESTYKILQVPAIVTSLSVDDWNTPLDVIIICARNFELPLNGEQKNNLASYERNSLEAIYVDVLAMLERYYTSPDISIFVPGLLKVWLNSSQFLAPSSSQLLYQHYKDELMCYPSHPDWLENISELFHHLFLDKAQDTNLRTSVIQHIHEILRLVSSTIAEQSLVTTCLSLLRLVVFETDCRLCQSLIDLVVHIALHSAGEYPQSAVEILADYSSRAPESRDRSESKSNAKRESFHSVQAPIPGSSASIGVISVDQSLLPNLSKLDAASSVRGLSEPRNVRTGLDHAAIEGLICVFVSNFANSAHPGTHQLLTFLFGLLTSQQSSEKIIRILQVLACLRIDLEGHLYLDCENQALDAATFCSVARTCCLDGQIASDLSCNSGDPGNMLAELNKYLEALTWLIFNSTDWNLYSLAIEAAKVQLSNRQLFGNCKEALLHFRSLLCSRLLSSGPFEMKGVPVSAKREDVIIPLVELLALLVGYHDMFSKPQEDEIVAALQNVLSHHQRATPACIRTLTICVYEIPLSTSKNMSSILLRISQLITSTNASVHILEFLSALARLDNQYVNFREDDYRRVFGIALQQIQYSNATGQDAVHAGNPDPLSQPMHAYVLMLAFDSLYAWFLALKLSQRPRYLKWIVDGLLSANPQMRSLDDRGQVCFDFLARFCYSNSEIKSDVRSTNKFEIDQSSVKSWLFGNSVMTLRTMNLSGLTEITVRRPSGTTYFLCKPNSDFEALRVVSASEARNLIFPDDIVGETERKIRSTLSGLDTTAFTPSHMLLQITAPPELSDNEKPILLFEDDVTRRAVSTLDRIPSVDFHKIGIIYVGKGQTCETEILANTYGSPEYVAFLGQLGELVRLKENTSVYTGGLDTLHDEDGEFAYVHKDKISQIIFHTCTMMPTRLDVDQGCTRKKSHIGNDFVNIIWNCSNQPYDPLTIASEFNFINIVVMPANSRISQQADLDARSEAMYRVKILPHEALPNISPITDWRLVSACNVSTFVRTIAVQCNVYAQIHHSPRGSFSSMWTQRLAKIHTLKQRTLQKYNELNDDTDHSKTTSTYNFTAYL